MGPRAVEDPGVLLDDLRIVKGPEEISRIRKATALTVAAFRETLGGTRPGMGEWEVESLLCCGPAGGGGFRGHITPSVVTHSTFIPRAQVGTTVEIFEA